MATIYLMVHVQNSVEVSTTPTHSKLVSCAGIQVATASQQTVGHIQFNFESLNLYCETSRGHVSGPVTIYRVV